MWILWTAAYFIFAVGIHALTCRILSGNRVIKFLVGGSSVVGLLAFHLLILNSSLWVFFSSLTIYAFLCELYIFLFTLVGSSISAKLLVTLRTKKLSDDEIARLYSTTGMVKSRIERLQATDLVCKLGSQNFKVSPKGEILVRAFSMFQWFFGHSER
jgi:hypothetical protein